VELGDGLGASLPLGAGLGDISLPPLGDGLGASLPLGAGLGDISLPPLGDGLGASLPLGAGLGDGVLPEAPDPDLPALSAQRELSGNCLHKMVSAAGESLTSAGLSFLPPVSDDWAIATPLAAARVRAVPIKTKYFIFISLNLTPKPEQNYVLI